MTTNAQVKIRGKDLSQKVAKPMLHFSPAITIPSIGAFLFLWKLIGFGNRKTNICIVGVNEYTSSCVIVLPSVSHIIICASLTIK